MPFTAIAPRLLRVRPRRGGGVSSYFGGDAAAVEAADSDVLRAFGIIARSGDFAALEAGRDFFLAHGSVASGIKDARKSLVLLDDFATWRMANNGNDRYFERYNGAVGDAGPNQVTTGVQDGWLVTTQGANNVFYVDADCAPYTQAAHWLRNHIISGAWNQGINRMSFLLRSTYNGSRASGGNDNFNFGTYIKPVDNFSPGAEGTNPQNGHHYYHGTGINMYAGRTIKLVMTHCPQHERGQPGSGDQIPIADYFHRMTRCYFQYWGHYPTAQAGTFYLAAVELYQSAQPEDDANIRSLSIQYTGTRYEVTWGARKNTDQTFNIRYRTDGQSMRANGFSSGTSGGSVSNPGNDYTCCFWASPNMPESTNGICVAIQRVGSGEFHELYLPYQASPANHAVPFVGVS